MTKAQILELVFDLYQDFCVIVVTAIGFGIIAHQVFKP